MARDHCIDNNEIYYIFVPPTDTLSCEDYESASTLAVLGLLRSLLAGGSLSCPETAVDTLAAVWSSSSRPD